MIPHHSIANMTSQRANFSVARVQKLADEIIAAHRKEIGEIRYLIAYIEENGVATDPALSESEAQAKVGSVEEALMSVKLAGVDVAVLKPEEVERVLRGATTCDFRRASEGEPVPAMTDKGGVIKIFGVLIPLNSGSPVAIDTLDNGLRLPAEDIDITVTANQIADWTDADRDLRRSEA